MSSTLLSISDLARETEVSAHTLRYYEKIGLVPTTERTQVGRHRRYTRRYVGWVRFLRRLRAAGMPVRKVRQYVEALNRGEEASWPERREILAAHRADVARRLAQLQHHLAVLDHKLEHGCDPDREAGRAPSTDGTGPGVLGNSTIDPSSQPFPTPAGSS